MEWKMKFPVMFKRGWPMHGRQRLRLQEKCKTGSETASNCVGVSGRPEHCADLKTNSGNLNRLSEMKTGRPWACPHSMYFLRAD